MLAYSFHPAAEKELIRLPLKEQGRILNEIKTLCQTNHPLQHRKVIKMVDFYLFYVSTLDSRLRGNDRWGGKYTGFPPNRWE